jgi:hypothetical protein
MCLKLQALFASPSMLCSLLLSCILASIYIWKMSPSRHTYHNANSLALQEIRKMKLVSKASVDACRGSFKSPYKFLRLLNFFNPFHDALSNSQTSESRCPGTYNAQREGIHQYHKDNSHNSIPAPPTPCLLP